jgi:hypothetical protein
MNIEDGIDSFGMSKDVIISVGSDDSSSSMEHSQSYIKSFILQKKPICLKVISGITVIASIAVGATFVALYVRSQDNEDTGTS